MFREQAPVHRKPQVSACKVHRRREKGRARPATRFWTRRPPVKGGTTTSAAGGRLVGDDELAVRGDGHPSRIGEVADHRAMFVVPGAIGPSTLSRRLRTATHATTGLREYEGLSLYPDSA